MAIQPLSGNYVATVPQGTQQINNTQSPIETNFQDISELIAINHIGFNTADTFGKHNYVDYYNQSSAPGASTGTMVIFSQIINGTIQLFYQYPNNPAVYPLTTSATSPSYNPNYVGWGRVIYFSTGSYIEGFQYLSSGISMVFGMITISFANLPIGNYSYAVNYGQWGGQPVFTQGAFYIDILPWALTLSGTTYSSTGLLYATPLNATQFIVTIQNTTSINSAVTFRYMAIGV